MQTIGEIKIKCNTTNVDIVNAKNEIDIIIETIKSMNLVELEVLLEGKINETESGKYEVLAILRDVFISYETLGDTELILDVGHCGNDCIKNAYKVLNLRGNNSGKDFAFVIEKESNKLSGFHVCPKFMDSNNKLRPSDEDLCYNALKKHSEMKNGKIWDDARVKKAFLKARAFFNK